MSKNKDSWLDEILVDFEMWRTKLDKNGNPIKKSKWEDYEREQFQPQLAKQQILQAIKDKMPKEKQVLLYNEGLINYYNKGYNQAIKDFLETLGIEV